MISTSDRVKLNYSISTIASIIVYTFSIPTFATLFSSLWPHTLYFIIAELLKFLLVQKLYSLETATSKFYNQDGARKRRSNKASESIKFAALMLAAVVSFAFICIIMGGEHHYATDY